MVVRGEENEQDLVGSASQRKKAKKGKKRQKKSLTKGEGRGIMYKLSRESRGKRSRAARCTL